VLLKQPGWVPVGAGVLGFMSELAPPAWHLKHSGAFPASVNTWFGWLTVVPPIHCVLSGCGAFVWQLSHDGVIPIGFV
jgi:hypothetical protein